MPLRPSGSSRMVEASQLETAVAARSILAPAGCPWRKKAKPGVPPQIRVGTDIWDACHTKVGLIVIYCYMATRTRSLPIYNWCCCLQKSYG